MSRPILRRTGLGALSALGLALAATIAISGPAQAHNWIISATPAEGETLTELPEAFEIRTNDALLDLGGVGGKFAFLIQDAAALYYGDGCVRVVGPSMFTTPVLGEAGDYTVVWQYVSADGHTLSGDYGFTWAPEGDFVPATGSVHRPSCGADEDGSEEGVGDDEASTAPNHEGGISEDTWWLIAAGGAVIASGIASWILARQRRRPTD